MTQIEDLTEKILAFRDERNWRQFHTPKDLAVSVSIEAAELLECFQWDRVTPVVEIHQEIADVLIYLLELASLVGMDVQKGIEEKLKINAEKYPKEKV